MGVPSFYRWLHEKYPKCVVAMKEMREIVIDGIRIPVDATAPNPNDIEFDNFYIDMNGIIHPCAHPEVGEQPETEEDMFVNIMKYIDRLMNAVRPRRMLFLAVDGVAPRAKMNQQRSRRFRAAQEAQELQEVMERTRKEMIELGLPVPPAQGPAWDSNVITPGTPFMHKLGIYLRFYIQHRMNTNKAWKSIKVILSDASQPGEGEHKIMQYIRRQRTQPGYDPNQHHILHGLDADLIMLGLATHEARFTILREEVYFGRADEEMKKTAAAARIAIEDALNGINNDNNDMDNMSIITEEKPLQMLHIYVLREYLQLEFEGLKRVLPFPFNFERIVDDFVFLCFFVGNDFLPHLPSLDIREGALDYLQNVYKRILPAIGDYLTYDGGEVNLRCVAKIMAEVGSIEDEVFRRKKVAEERETSRNKHRNEIAKYGGKGRYGAAFVQESAVAVGTVKTGRFKDAHMKDTGPAFSMERSSYSLKRSVEDASIETETASIQVSQDLTSNQKAADRIRDRLRKISRSAATSDIGDAVTLFDKREAIRELSPAMALEAKTQLNERVKEKANMQNNAYRNSIQDNVRLWEQGWKERYYSDKCKLEDIKAGGGKLRIQQAYVEGLCWIMRYYYQGVSDWTWYYPFHYAPFASDLLECDKLEIKFLNGKPFQPIEQLMAVLPPASAHALPPPCKPLMIEKSSPIIDFYPEEVPCDPNGRAMPWQWVVLLPFINEARLLGALQPLYSQFTDVEMQRNKFGPSYIFAHASTEFSNHIQSLYSSDNGAAKWISAEVNQGWSGSISRIKILDAVTPLGQRLIAPEKPVGVLKGVLENQVVCAEYEMPPQDSHICKLLPGAILPTPQLASNVFIKKCVRLSRDLNIAELGLGPLPKPEESRYNPSYGTLRGVLVRPQTAPFVRHPPIQTPFDSPFQGTSYMQNSSFARVQQELRGWQGGFTPPLQERYGPPQYPPQFDSEYRSFGPNEYQNNSFPPQYPGFNPRPPPFGRGNYRGRGDSPLHRGGRGREFEYSRGEETVYAGSRDRGMQAHGQMQDRGNRRAQSHSMAENPSWTDGHIRAQWGGQHPPAPRQSTQRYTVPPSRPVMMPTMDSLRDRLANTLQRDGKVERRNGNASIPFPNHGANNHYGQY